MPRENGDPEIMPVPEKERFASDFKPADIDPDYSAIVYSCISYEY